MGPTATFWRVKEIIENDKGRTTVLQRVGWFKPIESADDDAPCRPGLNGSYWSYEPETIDLGGLNVALGDHVSLVVSVALFACYTEDEYVTS